MDLRSVIDEKNREGWEAAEEERRRLARRKQPLLAESSELSNLMAGERGKINRTNENLERYEELGRQIRELDRGILEVRNKADAVEREPLDVDALREAAEAALEDAKRLRKWASYQAFYLRSKPYAQDIETAEARIEQLDVCCVDLARDRKGAIIVSPREGAIDGPAQSYPTPRPHGRGSDHPLLPHRRRLHAAQPPRRSTLRIPQAALERTQEGGQRWGA